MSLSFLDHAPFKAMGREALKRAADFPEPMLDTTTMRPLDPARVQFIACARMDAMIFWCGGSIAAPYNNPADNQAWSAVVGDEIDSLARWGNPVREAQLKLK